MNRLGRLGAVGIVLGLLFGLLPAAPATGQEAEARQEFGMTVSPARLVVDAGRDPDAQTFRVLNSGRSPIRVVVSVTGMNGGRDAAAKWVTAAPDEFTLEAGEVQSVKVRLAVPRNADPGDHNISVTFTAKGRAPMTGGVAVDRAIGAQLIVNVPGDVVERVRLENMSAPWFSDGGPVRLALGVSNEGTVRRDFTGDDALQVRRDGDVVASFEDLTVLAGSERRVEASWASPPLFCICRLTVVTDDGEGGLASVSTRVIVFPLRLVIGLLLVAIGLRMWLRARRRRLQAMLERARQEGRQQALAG